MSLTPEERAELLRLLEARDQLRLSDPIGYYYPEEGARSRSLYPKHLEFFQAGSRYRERCLMAGNRTGKTLAGAYEMAVHLTGDYPDWWQGRRFTGPIEAWAAGKTNETARDIVQARLVGREGLVPPHRRGGVTYRRGVPGAVDTMLIHHVSGYESVLQIKSYQQGRDAFEGTAKHVVWLDEEPPVEIYDECLVRTATTEGLIYVTFTPLDGATDAVRRFLSAPEVTSGEVSPGRYLVMMGWRDAPHLTEAAQRELLASIPPHMHRARVEGLPLLGSGAVFSDVQESDYVIEPFPIPDHWAQIGGMDFGWDHPFAAVRLAWDRDADVVHVCRDFRQREMTPLSARLALDGWDLHWLPWAWPHDGLQHDKGSGIALAQIYRNQGFRMLESHATFPDGGNSVEAGVAEMLDRMRNGRLKVHACCSAFIQEARTYHRKDGRIVKIGDDTISAARYALMMLRHAVQRPGARRTIRVRASSWRTA